MKSEAAKQVHLDNVVSQEADAGARDAKRTGRAFEPDWLEVARLVLLSRRIDQVEEEQLAPQGKTKLQLSSSSHELTQVFWV